jgi:hypothetical protein
MNDQSKRIIPDLDSVAHYLDEISLISDLLKKYLEIKIGGYSRDYYQDKVEIFIAKSTVIENRDHAIAKLLEDGIECKLL